jgi:hypothetical protein
VEEAVVQMAFDNPAFGQSRTCNDYFANADPGISVMI